MGKYIDIIKKSRTCFDKTYLLAQEVYPNNLELIELERRYVDVIRPETEVRADNDLNTGNTSAGTGTAKGVEFSTPQVNKFVGSSGEALNEMGDGGWLFDSPEFALGPETQAVIISTVDKVASAKIDKGQSVATEEIPSFSLGMTQVFDECTSVGNIKVSARTDKGKKPMEPIEAVPISVCPPLPVENVQAQRLGRRGQKASAQMRSPFVVRVVDIQGPYNTEEQKVSKILFRMSGDPK